MSMEVDISRLSFEPARLHCSYAGGETRGEQDISEWVEPGVHGRIKALQKREKISLFPEPTPFLFTNSTIPFASFTKEAQARYEYALDLALLALILMTGQIHF